MRQYSCMIIPNPEPSMLWIELRLDFTRLYRLHQSQCFFVLRADQIKESTTESYVRHGSIIERMKVIDRSDKGD